MAKPNPLLHARECETLKELLQAELKAIRGNKFLMAAHEDAALKLYYEELKKIDPTIDHPGWGMQDRMESLLQKEVDAIRARRDNLQSIIVEGRKNCTLPVDYEVHKIKIEILERLLSERFKLKVIMKEKELGFIPVSE